MDKLKIKKNIFHSLGRSTASEAKAHLAATAGGSAITSTTTPKDKATTSRSRSGTALNASNSTKNETDIKASQSPHLSPIHSPSLSPTSTANNIVVPNEVMSSESSKAKTTTDTPKKSEVPTITTTTPATLVSDERWGPAMLSFVKNNVDSFHSAFSSLREEVRSVFHAPGSYGIHVTSERSIASLLCFDALLERRAERVVICHQDSHLHNSSKTRSLLTNFGYQVKTFATGKEKTQIEEIVTHYKKKNRKFSLILSLEIKQKSNPDSSEKELEKNETLAKHFKAQGLALHLDASRFEELLATNSSAFTSHVKLFDLISFSLTKGLGVMMGACILGSQNYMEAVDEASFATGLRFKGRSAAFVAACATYGFRALHKKSGETPQILTPDHKSRTLVQETKEKDDEYQKLVTKESEEEFIEPSLIEARREFWKKAAQDGSFIKNEKKRKEEEDKKKREERKKKEEERKKRDDEKKKDEKHSETSEKKNETANDHEKEKEKDNEKSNSTPSEGKSVNFNAPVDNEKTLKRLLVPRLRMSRVILFSALPSSPKGDNLAEIFEKNGIDKKWAEVLVEQGVTDKESVAELLLEDLVEIGFPDDVAQSLITLAAPWKAAEENA